MPKRLKRPNRTGLPVGIYLDRELYRRLHEKADERERTLTWVISMLIRKWVAE